MIRFIDTHVHLNDPAFRDDLPEVLERAGRAGVARMVVAGYDLSSSITAVSLAGQYGGLWAAVGYSPHEARTWDDQGADRLAELAADRKVVAIGEIGLDYHYDFSPRQRQLEVFQHQIDLAVRLNLPVVIHSREAAEHTMDILRRSAPRLRGGVMHCFSGSLETALTACNLGFLISFAGPLTYKNAERLRETAARLPENRLLSETDAPYLTPHPDRSQRRNEPAKVGLIVSALADAKGKSLEEMAAAIWANAERVFSFAEQDDGKRG